MAAQQECVLESHNTMPRVFYNLIYCQGLMLLLLHSGIIITVAISGPG